jgi:hypothetical protein
MATSPGSTSPKPSKKRRIPARERICSWAETLRSYTFSPARATIADVEELADAGRGDKPHRPAEELAVGPADGPGIRLDRHDGPADILIGQEIMAAA